MDRASLAQNPLWQFARPILGQPVWGVKRGYGSFLTLEFGEPALEVHERRSGREGLRRSARVHGYWHLWIYCCHWQILQNGELRAWSEDGSEIVDRAIHRLEGQKLFSTEVDPLKGRSIFRFDLGGEIKTWPYEDDPSEEQWIFFAGKEVFTYRADGHYRYGPSNVPHEVGDWLPLF